MNTRAPLLLVVSLSIATAACAAHRAPVPPPKPIDGVVANVVAEHLAGALRFKTVSHQDPAQDDVRELEGLQAYLAKTYPRVYASTPPEIVNGHGLLFRWAGTDSSLAPVLFMAHQDVVPVEPGTESKWTHAPFSGDIADGYVWGRGAMDDKGSLIGLLEAFEALQEQGFRPARTIYLASGFDEEVGGTEGTAKIAQLLASRGVHLDTVVDEGSAVGDGVVPYVKRRVAGIAISEKGYVSVQLESHVEGGHSARPPQHTAIGVLASAIGRLEKEQLAPRLLPSLRTSLHELAPEMPFSRRAVIASLWLTRPLLLSWMAKNPASAPDVRTTTAVTMIDGGVKENVLPSMARAVVNFRILPGETIETTLAHVRKVVDDPRVTVTKLERIQSEPAPLSRTTSRGWNALAATIHDFYPDAIVIPTVVNGATDARWFTPITDDVYRFVPRVVQKSDLARIHGTDERAGVEDMARSVAAYEALIRRTGEAR